MASHLPIWEMGQIPASVCDIAVQEFEQLPSRGASMGIDGEKTLHAQRDTTIRFAHDGHWFAGAMLDVARRANAKHWGYEITGNEAIQYAVYDKDQHYDWHTDIFPLAGMPTDRKITVVCLMNSPDDFLGGKFELRLYQDYTAPLVKGSVIAFPSILYHRVAPVLSGTRASATIWLFGPRFK